MADLRDDRVVRASYFSQLLDLGGSDLKKVYEPVSNQIGYVMTFFVLLMVCHFAWKRYRRWREGISSSSIPFKILKPPSSMISDQQEEGGAKKKKRVCAVIGGTGFIGSHVVNELVRRNKYYVFVLGRKFRPERTNPDADCHIQVDMLDPEGLENALQGVESVICTAAVIPNVFSSADEIYSKNRWSLGNVLVAAKKAGVKHLVHLSGIHMQNAKIRNPVFRAFINAFYTSEKDFINADSGGEEEGGMRTCAVCPSNILGSNSSFLDGLVSGQMTSSPMSDVAPTSFMPVEYLCKALVNAEEILATPSTAGQIAGKALQLRGESMTWRDLLTLPGWPKKISPTPAYMMSGLVRLNVLCATLFRWAPFGPDLAPGLLELMEVAEEDLSEEEVQQTYRLLGVGPPHPPVAEYVQKLVQDYKDKQEKKEK